VGTALYLQGVSKWFEGLHVLDNVTMEVMEGERIAIIGPNGAGKTTLFNVINGERILSKGKIMLFGVDISKKPVRYRVKLGLRRTYQTTSVFDTLTVGENIMVSILGLDRKSINPLGDSKKLARSVKTKARIEEVANMVDLKNKLDIIAGNLSHGERRQLEIGLSVAHEPRIILFDEPAAGLSPEEKKTIVNILKFLPIEATILLIEHDMDVALKFAKRVIVLHEGRLIGTGSPDEICSNAFVQEIYLGGKVEQ
jgi:branched-chain amino acid transport system ATP-binding protein